MIESKLTAKLMLFSSLIIPTAIFAQDTGEGEVIILEEMEADNTVPIEESILPTTRPFVSVYGTERSILDTPRNVTIISREQLDRISIKDPRDFSKLTSSSYTGSNFGAPTTPTIRGQIADTLINGMRKGLSTNGNGLPLNFNAVESVNILKGPPSVMIGASQYVGGYVDLVTKKPKFGGNDGFLSVTFDTEGLLKAQLDQNYVVDDELAFRVSVTGEQTDDYYWDDYKRKTFAIYGAMTWKPNDRYRLELNSEFFNADYTENWGLNRPTKELLDNGTYVTGIGTLGGFADTVTTTGTTTIERTKRLHGEGDDSSGNYLSFQAIQTFTPNPDSTIQNNTLFQYRDRETYSSYQYSEVLRDNFRIENRTEYRNEFDIFGLLNKINLGFALSYQDVYAVNDFYSEPANGWDLANQSYADIAVTDDTVFLDPTITSFLDSVPIYGEAPRGKLSFRPGSTNANYFFPSTGLFVLGNGDANDSQTSTASVFLQNDVELTEKFSVLLGGRLDFVNTTAEDPQFDNLVRYLEGFGYTDSDFAGVNKAEDSHSDFVPNYNIGLLYKLTETKSIYGNYNYSESIPTGLGGGVQLDQDTGIYNRDGFDVKSELFEAGYKGTYLDGKLYYVANVFYQTRLQPQSQGPDQKVQVRGFETEISYQPSKKLYFVAGYSYIDSLTKNGALASQFPISSVPSVGGEYTYSSFPGFSGIDAETPGVPDHILNGLLSYSFTDEFSGSIGLLVTAPMNLGFNIAAEDNGGTALSSVEIPWQYSIDLGLRYETDKWAISFNLLNATDEENWGAVNGLYGNDSVFAELPRRLEVTGTIKW